MTRAYFGRPIETDEPDFPEYDVVDSADLDAMTDTGIRVGDTAIHSVSAAARRIGNMLNEPSIEVDASDFGTPELAGLVKRLRRLVADERGYGLSAVQIGFPARVFVFGVDAGSGVYVNPEIVSHGRDVETKMEGCLSLPHVLMPITRWRVITARWQDETGKQYQGRLAGLAARVFQHELDHLNGILIIDEAAGVTEV